MACGQPSKLFLSSLARLTCELQAQRRICRLTKRSNEARQARKTDMFKTFLRLGFLRDPLGQVKWVFSDLKMAIGCHDLPSQGGIRRRKAPSQCIGPGYDRFESLP